jgi:nucleoside-triphosphatase THEP1
MPPLRLFLTGNPGSGKTTVVRRVSDILREQNMRVGGVISSEIRRQGTRVGFSLEDLLTHETGILAHADQKDGPRVGKYRVNLADVERVGIIHKRASHPLVTAVKSDPAHRIIEVTLGNRAQLPNEITRQIIGNA